MQSSGPCPVFTILPISAPVEISYLCTHLSEKSPRTSIELLSHTMPAGIGIKVSLFVRISQFRETCSGKSMQSLCEACSLLSQPDIIQRAVIAVRKMIFFITSLILCTKIRHINRIKNAQRGFFAERWTANGNMAAAEPQRGALHRLHVATSETVRMHLIAALQLFIIP